MSFNKSFKLSNDRNVVSRNRFRVFANYVSCLQRETNFALRPVVGTKRYFRSIPRSGFLPQNQSMEDTPQLTRLRFLEEEEGQLLEDFFSGRNWDSQKQVRWAKMQAEVFFVEDRHAA